MRVENGLLYATMLMLSVLLVAVAAYVMAAVLEGNGGFLANLSQLMAAGLTLLFVSTVALTITFAFRVLMRQPDDVSSADPKARARVIRERFDDAIVYQDLGALKGPAMLLHRSGKKAPRVQFGIEGLGLPDQEPAFRRSDVVLGEDLLDNLLQEMEVLYDEPERDENQ